MDEKKEKTKVRLSTAILVLIIIILIVAGVFIYYQNYLTNKQLEGTQENLKLSQEAVSKLQNTISNTNNTTTNTTGNTTVSTTTSTNFKQLSIENATPKNVDKTVEAYYQIEYCGNNIFTITIDQGKASILTNKEPQEFVIEGLVTNTSELKLEYGKQKPLTGFNKKIVDVKFGWGQQVSGSIACFLMEDGTVEYSTINNLVKNLSSQGKVENLSNIEKIVSVNTKYADGGSTTILAIDNENNLYDIGYMINK